MPKTSEKEIAVDYLEIIRSMPDLYLIIDPIFSIVEASDSYLKATQTVRKNIIGKNIFDVFPDNPDDKEATGVKNLSHSLNQVLKTKLPDSMAVQKYDVRVKKENKLVYEKRYWSPINTPVLNKKNEIQYIIHRVEDVTDFIDLRQQELQQAKLTKQLRTRAGQMEIEIFKRAQEIQEANKQLRSANKELGRNDQEQKILYKKMEKINQLKTQFFANVSHELRTPLTLILGTLEKLISDEALFGYQYDLEMIERNTRILLKLVNDLLDVAKLEAGKINVNYFKLDLVKIIKHIASIFESHAKERHIDFSIQTPSMLIAEFDPDKIQRVMMNLFSNSFKFTPPNGIVNCNISATKTHAIITVSDNGPGIPEQLKKTIFERFFQGEESTTRQHGGFGLGLAIVKDFVELHGGSIQVERAPEGGAKFIIELPLEAPRGTVLQTDYYESSILSKEIAPQIIKELHTQERVVSIPLHTESDNTDWPLILIIEDNVEMNQHISQVLSTTYRTASAFDGKEGYEQTLSLYPDLILCDIMMPRMSGIQFLHEIRQHDELNDIPIVVLTAKIDHELSAKLLSEGAQDYLSKPFSQLELKARVYNLIRLKKNKEEIEQKNLELASANQELESFSYSVSHDLRNPLSSIIGFSSLILDAYTLEPEIMEYVNHILISGKRMEELINDLFALSQAIKSEFKSEVVNLTKMVTSVIKALKVQNPHRKIKTIIKNDVKANCDAHLIRIVLENIIGNAWKYTSKNAISQIEFGVLDDKHPIYFVRDNGVGFLQVNANKLFTPFSRLHLEKDFPGSGVGLAIVKRIIQRHGGRIWVESEIDKGTTIYFTLSTD